MSDSSRFHMVFVKLGAALEEAHKAKCASHEVTIHMNSDATLEEMDEIDRLRRIVLEVVEPVPMSFTTT